MVVGFFLAGITLPLPAWLEMLDRYTFFPFFRGIGVFGSLKALYSALIARLLDKICLVSSEFGTFMQKSALRDPFNLIYTLYGIVSMIIYNQVYTIT